ncbi:hypothetical protein HPP92_002594 [Vanilla planifolia]|uniref:Flavonoid 3'-monooxygenase n=1 Tax=Vanilla planifolia TaxID=51239 RepID=A0A835VI45_VANPL|nr:hypothetical protein HPP92_002594 [Vanilla planifolia]
MLPLLFKVLIINLLFYVLISSLGALRAVYYGERRAFPTLRHPLGCLSVQAQSPEVSPLPPGPRGLPLLGYLTKVGPNPHQTFYNLSKIYGPLLHLRFGIVDVVVPSSAEVAAKLFRNDLKVVNRPKNSGAEHILYNYQDIGFVPYGPRWRMLRKLCALHLFSPKALDDLQDTRREEMDLFVGELAGKGGAVEVDVSREVAKCVANSLSRLLIGRRVFDAGQEKEAGEFKWMVMELMHLSGSFCVADFLPGLGWLDPQGLISRMKKLNRRFDAFLNRFMAEHREPNAAGDNNNSGKRDLLSVMLEQQENADGEGGKLTDVDIKALLVAMFAAGSDSTSITSEWALAELIRKPEILARAQAELDSAVGRNRLVMESDLSNLPMLQDIVKETLRLHPPAPISVPRVAVEDCEVDGYLIPKGSTILLNIWAIGRDPVAWPDEPNEFRPDRFLPGGKHEGEDLKGSHFGLIPFGAGRRICVGMNLGLRMVTFMTATMIHSFDWFLPEGQTGEDLDMVERANGLTLIKAVPLVARPVPRLKPEVYANL